MAKESSQTVPITDLRHAVEIGQWVGAIHVVEALQKQEAGRLPGFALALALAEKIEVEMRSQNTAKNLRAVAKAGIDVRQAQKVVLGFDAGGKPRLEVEMMDLADMAEGD